MTTPFTVPDDARARRFLVTVDGEVPEVQTLGEIADANHDDDDLLQLLCDLDVGDDVAVGGGAAPLVVSLRLPDEESIVTDETTAVLVPDLIFWSPPYSPPGSETGQLRERFDRVPTRADFDGAPADFICDDGTVLRNAVVQTPPVREYEKRLKFGPTPEWPDGVEIVLHGEESDAPRAGRQ